MAHDELLKVLDEVISDDVHPVATQTAQALRAVVELAQPRVGISFSEDYDEGYTYAMAKIIQAIEKELK